MLRMITGKLYDLAISAFDKIVNQISILHSALLVSNFYFWHSFALHVRYGLLFYYHFCVPIYLHSRDKASHQIFTHCLSYQIHNVSLYSYLLVLSWGSTKWVSLICKKKCEKTWFMPFFFSFFIIYDSFRKWKQTGSISLQKVISGSRKLVSLILEFERSSDWKTFDGYYSSRQIVQLRLNHFWCVREQNFFPTDVNWPFLGQSKLNDHSQERLLMRD